MITPVRSNTSRHRHILPHSNEQSESTSIRSPAGHRRRANNYSKGNRLRELLSPRCLNLIQLLVTCICPMAIWLYILYQAYHLSSGDMPVPVNGNNVDDADLNIVAGFDVPSRVFPPWVGELPCVVDFPNPSDTRNVQQWHPLSKDVQREPSTTGLLMVKIDKAGSSTLAGVAARMAYALAKKSQIASLDELPKSHRICRCRISHAWSLDMDDLSQTRVKAQSFLFTMVRDPKARAVSEFFHFKVGMGGLEASDDTFVNHLGSVHNFQLSLMVDTRDRKLAKAIRTEVDAMETVQQTMNNYDFVGVLERLDESLVLLQLILGLETSDMLYTSSKRQGSFIYINSRANNFEGECREIPKSFVSGAVEEYFSRDEWKRNNIADMMLYEAANQSLDRSIESIGREQFNETLGKFQAMQQMARERCEATLPCTNEGFIRPENETNCYYLDSGCNYPCLDTIRED